MCSPGKRNRWRDKQSALSVVSDVASWYPSIVAEMREARSDKEVLVA